MRNASRLWALAITLIVHAGVLAYLAFKPIPGQVPAQDFVEVLWSDAIEPMPTPKTMEEAVAERLAGRVANLRADRSAETSSERRSTGGPPNEGPTSAQVEAELRAFEAAEAARLAAQKKDFGLEAIPDVTEGDVETLSGWDNRYQGEVTVSFECAGRRAQHLDMPGYRCEEGGVVEASVVVGREGQVVEVDLAQTQVPTCLLEAARQSAARSRFNIDLSASREQLCMIRYVFVPQSD